MKTYISFFLTILIICVFLAGCAAKEVRVGSKTWHEQRLTEIQQAYDDGEITKEKYLELKTQADQIRAEYYGDKGYPYHSHIGYSHGRGSSIGVGVGF